MLVRITTESAMHSMLTVSQGCDLVLSYMLAFCLY